MAAARRPAGVAGRRPATQDPVEAARDAALRLLEARALTTAELTERLGRRGHDPGAVRAALDRLAAVGLVDDVALATEAAARRAAGGASAVVIERELLDRGIGPAIAEATAAQAAPAEGDLARCHDVAAARLRRLAGLRPEVQARRLAGYLGRRGYSPDVVEQVIHQLIDFAGDEQSGRL